MPHGDDELLALAASLRHALTERDAWEARLRVAPDEHARRMSLAACELVVARRVALHRWLLRDGWVPPPRVVRGIVEDELLLDEPLGGAGG